MPWKSSQEDGLSTLLLGAIVVVYGFYLAWGSVWQTVLGAFIGSIALSTREEVVRTVLLLAPTPWWDLGLVRGCWEAG